MKNVFVRLSGLLLIMLPLAFSHNAYAVQASPFSFVETQPDGSRVELSIHGDEHYHWLTTKRGFTVMRDSAGRLVYAERAQDGDLRPGNLVVGKDRPTDKGILPGLLPTKAVLDSYRSIKEGRHSAEERASRVPPLGNVKNMVIMIRFADHASRPLPSNADIDVLFNAVGGDANLAPTGSIKDVYLENSYGQMTLNSTVFGWIDLPQTEAYYANGQSGDSTLWQALRFALDQVDQTIDFRDFDTDGDNQIDAIAFIHSGYGAEWGGTDQYGTSSANRIWSHRWSIQQPAWTSAEGVVVSDYHISPGVWDTSGSEIGRIGVIAHETGHFFGIGDLYDTDGNGSGIGSFGLMANSWGFDGSQLYPPHFSPWSKEFLGWVTPTVIDTAGSYSLEQAEFSPSVFRIDEGFPANEYLLIENRQPVGFDGSMPQGGLVVWHIDDSAGYHTQGYPGQAGWPGNGNHYRVAVLQADGDYDMEKNLNRGDAGDVYRAGGVSTLGPNTTPNTDAYQNGNIIETGITLSSISAAGANMNFSFSLPLPPPDGVAVADHITTFGTLSGTYASTHQADGVYQTLTETDSGGKPSNRYDRAEHIWRFTPNATDNQFNVNAYRTDGGDADSGFTFSWSSSASGPWTEMLTVSSTSAGSVQSFTLGSVPGTVYIKAEDNDRTAGQRSHDVLRVDQMFFDEGVPNTDPPGAASGPQPGDGDTNISVGASVSWNAGSNATSHDVYFGLTPVPVFVGNQSGTSYDPGALLNDTLYYWRVDEVNSHGTTVGSVWSFTTEGAGGSCSPLGAACSVDSDCCSNKCKGRAGAKVCK